MQKNIFVLFLLLSIHSIYAQEGTRFYLTPELGIEWSFSGFEDKSLIPPYVKRTNPSPSFRYGMGIMADFDNKWGLELGYNGADLGWGVLVRSLSDSAVAEVGGSLTSFTTVHRVYLQFFKPKTLVAIRKKRGSWLLRNAKKKRHYDYLAIFDLGFLAGLSFEYIPPFTYTGNIGFGASPGRFNGWDDIGLFNHSGTEPNRFGGGIYFGLYSQFLNRGEKRLQLSIIYQQGIQKRIVSNWSTSINGIEQPDFQTFTRGSYLALQAAFPIKFLPLGAKRYKKLK